MMGLIIGYPFALTYLPLRPRQGHAHPIRHQHHTITTITTISRQGTSIIISIISNA